MIKRLLCFVVLLFFTIGCVAEGPPAVSTPALASPLSPTQPPDTQITTNPSYPSPSPTAPVIPTPPPPPPTPTFPPNATPILLTPLPTMAGSEAPAVNAIQEPLLIDGERGWIVTQAQVNTVPKTVVLSTADGRLLTAYDVVGKVTLNRARNQIIVDTGQSGLVVLDAETGLEMTRIDLPAADVVAAPQVDPEQGLIYAFRGRDIHIIDPVRLGNSQLIQTSLESSVCNQPGDFAPIVRSNYDLINRRLYLTFLTAVCTPWSSVTLVAYAATTASLTELGRLEVAPNYQAVVFLGGVYGLNVSPLGPTSFWAWNHGVTYWYLETEEYGGAASGIIADWGRRLIYESIGGRVRVVDPITRRAIHEVEIPALAEGGRLAGHDPITDQLYILNTSGQLQTLATTRLTGQTIIVPPDLEIDGEVEQQTAVSSLAVSPSWHLDHSMAGLWENGNCPVEGGLLYLFRPERGWFRSVVNDDERCEAIGAFALTPIFGATGELFAASNRAGAVFKSEDFGLTWRQVGQPLLAGNTTFRQLLVSPGYGISQDDQRGDQTLFVHASNGRLFRSQDDGQNWQPLDVRLDQFAISPEFGKDHLLVGASGTELYLSRDRGDSWQLLGPTPGNEPLTILSIAPLFAQWQTLFAFSAGGNFYRSLNGGITWELAISTSPAEAVQIAYAPGIEANRPMFLLHNGRLDASYDGWNSTWAAPTLPPTVFSSLTSLAISPNFVEDGRLFVGTADGQVISLDARIAD